MPIGIVRADVFVAAIPHIDDSIERVDDMAAAKQMTKAMVEAAFRNSAAGVPDLDCGFRSGDLIVYPTHGVGRIEQIGDEDLGGYRVAIIRLFFAEMQMTIRIPVAAVGKSGLRKLSSPSELDEAMAILKGRRRVSSTIWARRSECYRLKINSGALNALAGVVRDLQAMPGQDMSYSQRNLYSLAIERLADEFAAVQGTDREAMILVLEQDLRHGGAQHMLETAS